MTEWIDAVEQVAASGESSVLVTVAGIRGSAPRETGAHMIVTAKETIGSIGGGQLEYQCTARAADMLTAKSPLADRRRFSLGANCGQCCGGVVEILFDLLPASRADWFGALAAAWRSRRPAVLATAVDGAPAKFLVCQHDDTAQMAASARKRALELLETGGAAAVADGWLLEPVRQTGIDIAVFGAGHVGTATVDILSRLDCRIRWIDSRRSIFPDHVPPNVARLGPGDPAREVAALPPHSYYLVMTHSHPVDLDICAQILRRDDVAWCGLIGSVSKRRRFERMLKKQGIPETGVARLTCPIGIPGIRGKQPVEIALAVAAEILRVRDRRATGQSQDAYLEVAG